MKETVKIKTGTFDSLRNQKITGRLILARHNESEWNKLGIWAGTRDPHLTEHGFQRSKKMGALIKDIRIDKAFTSTQTRTIETFSGMLSARESHDVPVEHSSVLNERDYGNYTGEKEQEVEKSMGKQKFKDLHRGWDYPEPGVETLRSVYDRIVPYFLKNILPLVLEGKNILVVGHDNSLRVVVKYIEKISDKDIENFTFPFDVVLIYDLDAEGHMIHKEERCL